MSRAILMVAIARSVQGGLKSCSRARPDGHLKLMGPQLHGNANMLAPGISHGVSRSSVEVG